MFSECSSLKKLNILNFSIKSYKSIGELFSGFSAIEIICSPELKMKIRKKCPNLLINQNIFIIKK